MKDKWDIKSAINRILKSCEVKFKHNEYFVLKNTAGNRTLGAIDYINNYTKTRVRIVEEEVFNEL